MCGATLKGQSALRPLPTNTSDAYMFTGRERRYDFESGLYHYRNRAFIGAPRMRYLTRPREGLSLR